MPRFAAEPTGVHRWEGQRGTASGPTGVISLETTFWALGFLWLLSAVRVELDGERREVPWGRLRVPVAAGRHRLRVSCKYFGMDVGAAVMELDVRAGHMTLVGYRAPVVVFRPGKLRLLGEEPAPGVETPSGLPGPAPGDTAPPGWFVDPGDRDQRRWWDGHGWTAVILRPMSSARRAWVLALLVVPVVAVAAVVVATSPGASPGTALRDSTGWETVTEVEGVRFEMPRPPQHTTETVPGTDLRVDVYDVTFDDMNMAAFANEGGRPAGDNRSDAAVLNDVALGMATNVGGTIVDSRRVEVDGEPGLDVEIAVPRDGGLVVLARVALADDLLVGVQTVFEEDDRVDGSATHERMARSLELTGARG